MPRYNHYLTALRTERWPDRIVCVDCVPVCESPSATAKAEHERLHSWHAVCLQRADDVYTIRRTMTGATASVWWDEIRALTARPSCVWILSYHCGRIWSLLSLWEELEHGRITTQGTDYRAAGNYLDAVRLLRSDAPDPLAPISAAGLSALSARQAGYIVCEDPPCIARLKSAGQTGWLNWIDSRNFGAAPLEDSPPGGRRADWLARWVIRVASTLKTYRMGGLCSTAASQALQGYRYGYYTGGVYCHRDIAALALEGRGYYGGRCECYQTGACRAPVTHLDIRASYGAVMRDHPLPGQFRRHYLPQGGPYTLDAADAASCCARVRIESAEPAYPVRRDGLTIWPVGRYQTTLCGPELVDAIAHDRVIDVIEYTQYHMDYHCQEYANALHNMRTWADGTGDDELSSLAKRLLVALAGKLGQRDHRWLGCTGMAADRPYGEWLGAGPDGTPARYRALAWTVQRDTDTGYSADAVPAMAGWITSAARMALIAAIRVAGWDSVYYCDTDAVLVAGSGYERMRLAGLVHSGLMGKWQVKGTHTAVEVRGIKHYVLDGVMTCAGLPRGLCTDYGDGIHYWYHDYPAHQIQHGQRPEARRVLRRYSRESTYRHGVVGEDGRVSPIRLQEW